MGEQHANSWRVSRHRLVADATVGVIANPMSGRDRPTSHVHRSGTIANRNRDPSPRYPAAGDILGSVGP
ncbi:hypothetical protein AB0J63_39510 [Streptosporangium canum]|uniref:hypothetical protein n=1 Tax=Streptosporangium canum TaxID=324952 RepID=UPI00343FE30A